MDTLKPLGVLGINFVIPSTNHSILGSQGNMEWLALISSRYGNMKWWLIWVLSKGMGSLCLLSCELGWDFVVMWGTIGWWNNKEKFNKLLSCANSPDPFSSRCRTRHYVFSDFQVLLNSLDWHENFTWLKLMLLL